MYVMAKAGLSDMVIELGLNVSMAFSLPTKCDDGISQD
jgi:hypothetical protein